MVQTLPNIVLVVCDTLGAKHMSLYGYERRTTPNLERLVEEVGFTVYTNCYTTSCWTSPAHASLFTGLYPGEHGVHEGNMCLAGNFMTLPELLEWCGYTTIGISCNLLIDVLTGFGKGFDVFHSIGGRLIFSESDPYVRALGRFVSENSRSNWDRIRNSIGWCIRNQKLAPLLKKTANKLYKKLVLSKRGVRINSTPFTKKALLVAKKEIRRAEKPFFVFLNLMQTHHNYNPPHGFRHVWSSKSSPYKGSSQDFLNHYYKGPYPDEAIDYFRDLYDEEVLFLDHCLARFTREILYSDAGDNTLIIITSDHGEHFGEDGHYGHILSLGDAVTKVPLMVRFPGGSCDVKGSLVQINDIVATLMDVVDCPVPPPTSSVSFVSSNRRSKALMEIIKPERWLSKMKDSEFKRHISKGPFQREIKGGSPSESDKQVS
ncbi:MAG: hypothetical protein DRI93_00115 [Aquificota bacterium]|nr:MAG: hypothetical protein DRI93_00115 [Aquificota bacterium]